MSDDDNTCAANRKHFGSELAELAKAVEARRKSLASEMQAEERALEDLLRLRDKMTTGGKPPAAAVSFDNDDLAMVDEEIEEHIAETKRLKRTLDQVHARQELHAQLFKEMATTLSGRSSILEEESQLLVQHPRLLERFAAKQLKLETLLHDKVRAASSVR